MGLDDGRRDGNVACDPGLLLPLLLCQQKRLLFIQYAFIHFFAFWMLGRDLLLECESVWVLLWWLFTYES